MFDFFVHDPDILEMHYKYYNNGTVAQHIIHEFDALLESYGLWYELGFDWSLTAYRKL